MVLLTNISYTNALHLSFRERRQGVRLWPMSTVPHQPENNMDNTARSGTGNSFPQLLRNTYLRRRTPTGRQLFAALTYEGIFESASISVRKNPVLSQRRIWTLYISSSLPRAFVWSEPIRSTIGRRLAKGIMSLWHRHSRIGTIRRRLHQLHNEGGSPEWQAPGVLKNVPESRHRLRRSSQAGGIS